MSASVQTRLTTPVRGFAAWMACSWGSGMETAIIKCGGWRCNPGPAGRAFSRPAAAIASPSERPGAARGSSSSAAKKSVSKSIFPSARDTERTAGLAAFPNCQASQLGGGVLTNRRCVRDDRDCRLPDAPHDHAKRRGTTPIFQVSEVALSAVAGSDSRASIASRTSSST